MFTEFPKKLSIAYLIQNAIALSKHTGQRTHIQQIVSGLKMNGHHITLLGLLGRRVVKTNDIDNLNYSDKLGISEKKLFTFIESGIRRSQIIFNLPYLGLFDSFRFFDACINNLSQVDLFHERYELMFMGAALASRMLKKPLILEVNADLFFELEFGGQPLRGLQKFTAIKMARFAYNSANIVICVSDKVKSDLIKNWGMIEDKIVVIPNAVDVHKFSPVNDYRSIRLQLGIDAEQLVIFVGNYQAWHDVQLLIECFSLVNKTLPSAKLMLIGDGPSRPTIAHMIEDLRLQNCVVQIGPIEYNQVPGFIASCDVAVAPIPHVESGFWGSPMKIFEYMAAGKAIVATKAGQVGEIITDRENGLLVEPGDVCGFSQAIIELLLDENLRTFLGRNARKRAVEKYSRESYIKHLEEIYSKVL